MSYSYIFTPLFLFTIAIILDIFIRGGKRENDDNFNEWSYQRYSRFMGDNVLSDGMFTKKMMKIKTAISKNKMEDIEEIADYAECTYEECLMKIKYMKNKRILGDYYIDKNKKIIRKCDEHDSELLKKYHDDIYLKHLQINEIAAERKSKENKDYNTLKKEVFKDIKYLNDKEIINGIKLNEDTQEIIYYTIEKHKNDAWYRTLNCPKCGALVDVPKGSSERCEYCNSIVEDKKEEK